MLNPISFGEQILPDFRKSKIAQETDIATKSYIHQKIEKNILYKTIEKNVGKKFPKIDKN